MISFARRIKSLRWKGGEEKSLQVTPCIKRVQWASFIEKTTPLLYCNYTGDPPLPSLPPPPFFFPTRATSIHLSGFFKTMSRVSNGKQGTFFRPPLPFSIVPLAFPAFQFRNQQMLQRPRETLGRFELSSLSRGIVRYTFHEKRETCS